MLWTKKSSGITITTVLYYRDEVNDGANKNNAGNYRINNSKTTTSKSLEYNTKLTGSTPDYNNDDNKIGTEVVVPLKYLSNFSRSLDLCLINSEIELDLPWS